MSEITHQVAASSVVPTIMLLAPLVGAMVNGLIYPLVVSGNSKTKATVAGSIALFAMLISFGAALFGVLCLKEGQGVIIETLGTFFQVGLFRVDISLKLDALSSFMTLIITGIGSLIHLYSIGYMSEESGANRYFSYLNLFCFAMLLLVLSDNLLLLFCGWEGVGLCSYLLIGYWFETIKNTDAANKAFIVNRIGDVGFLLATFILLFTFETLSITELMGRSSIEAAPVLTVIAVLFLIGASGKSAQFPLFVWLPDAMAGPTPVSALIHAATMVTAGIYLFARMHFIIPFAGTAMDLVMWTGLVTAVLGGLIALKQNDIKKALAYSTVSQLGFMFYGLGSGAILAALFHLLTHACFKGLLFLGAGSVIHGCHGEQDMRKMGGLRKSMPVTHFTMVVGGLAMAGVPVFSGFFSKDLILYESFARTGNAVAFILSLVVAFLTSLYTIRILSMTFWGKGHDSLHAHESPGTMTLPLVVLALLATGAGFLAVPKDVAQLFGLPEHWLLHVLGQAVSTPAWDHANAMLSEHMVTALAVAMSVLGLGIGYVVTRLHLSLAPQALHNLLEQKFYIDEIYHALCVKPYMYMCQMISHWIEDLGASQSGIIAARFFMGISAKVRHIQNGDLRVGLHLMGFGILMMASVFVFVF